MPEAGLRARRSVPVSLNGDHRLHFITYDNGAGGGLGMDQSLVCASPADEAYDNFPWPIETAVGRERTPMALRCPFLSVGLVNWHLTCVQMRQTTPLLGRKVAIESCMVRR